MLLRLTEYHLPIGNGKSNICFGFSKRIRQTTGKLPVENNGAVVDTKMGNLTDLS